MACQRRLAERQGLRGMPHSQQSASEGAPIPVRYGIIGAERLLTDRDCTLKARPRLGKTAMALEEPGEVAQACRGRGALRAKVFGDGQGAFQQRPRFRKIALRIRNVRQADQARYEFVMIGTQLALKYAKARLKIGRAAEKSPWSLSKYARLVRIKAVLGWFGPCCRLVMPSARSRNAFARAKSRFCLNTPARLL